MRYQETENFEFFTVDELVEELSEEEKAKRAKETANEVSPSQNTNPAFVATRADVSPEYSQESFDKTWDLYKKIPPENGIISKISKIKDVEGNSYAEINFKNSGNKLQDYGNKVISDKRPSDEEIAFVVASAKAKGWGSLKIDGDEEFKNKVWVECQKNGMTLKDFEPAPDLKKAWEGKTSTYEEPAKPGRNLVDNFLSKGGLTAVESGNNEKNPEKIGPVAKLGEYYDKEAVKSSALSASRLFAVIASSSLLAKSLFENGILDSTGASYVVPGAVVVLGVAKNLDLLVKDLKEKKNNKILSQLATLEVANNKNPQSVDGELLKALREQAKKRGLDKVINEKLAPFLAKGLDESKLPTEFLDKQGSIRPWAKFAGRVALQAAIVGTSLVAGPIAGMSVAGAVMLYKAGAIDKVYKLITGKETKKAQLKREELAKLSPEEKRQRKKKLIGNSIIALGTTVAACIVGAKMGGHTDIGESSYTNKATEMGNSLGADGVVANTKEALANAGDNQPLLNLEQSPTLNPEATANAAASPVAASPVVLAKQMGLSLPDGYVQESTFSIDVNPTTGSTIINHNPNNIVDDLLMQQELAKQGLSLPIEQQNIMNDRIGDVINHVAKTENIPVDQATEKVATYLDKAVSEQSVASVSGNETNVGIDEASKISVKEIVQKSGKFLSNTGDDVRNAGSVLRNVGALGKEFGIDIPIVDDATQVVDATGKVINNAANANAGLGGLADGVDKVQDGDVMDGLQKVTTSADKVTRYLDRIADGKVDSDASIVTGKIGRGVATVDNILSKFGRIGRH